MPDAPLSRRARRTFEEEAADRAALQESTSTTAQELTSGALSAIENERDAAFSRRDRRRMERLNHPLEAWTAEEEMLATGQIPAMTPERIAEQERISREKAARAAEEATAASQEFRRLAQADIRRAPARELEEPASLRLPSQPQVFQAPAAQASVFPAPTAQPQWAEEPPIDAADDFEFASTPVWPEEPASAAPHVAAPTPPSFNTPASPQPVPDAPEAGDIYAGDIYAGDIYAGDIQAADPHAGRPVVEPYQPIMALDDAPLLPVVHPVHVVHPSHDETSVEAQHTADEQSTMRSNVLDALFPPGSSQTALRQQDPFATRLTEEPAPTESGQIPTLLPPQEVPERAINPVDEIRRLAAEAMSGIERASKADEAAAAAAAAVGPTADPSARAEFDSFPRASAPPSQSLQDGAPYNAAPYNAAPYNAAPSTAAPYNAAPANAAPNGGSPAAARSLDNFAWDELVGGSPSATQAGTNAPVDSIGEWSRSAEHAPATPYGGMTPQHTGFDQLTQPYSGSAYGSAPASGQFPMPGQQGQPASGQFPMPGQQGQPASGQFPMPGQQGRQPAPQGLGGPQGPAWNSQPLHTEPPRPAEAQAFTPLSNVPKPDFSGLYQQGSPSAFPPLTGAINTAALNAAEFHGGDMSASGQGTGIRRPELPEVGGAKHFKWLHLAVIGALMFVLGVVIYNVAFSK